MNATSNTELDCRFGYMQKLWFNVFCFFDIFYINYIFSNKFNLMGCIKIFFDLFLHFKSVFTKSNSFHYSAKIINSNSNFISYIHRNK